MKWQMVIIICLISVRRLLCERRGYRVRLRLRVRVWVWVRQSDSHSEENQIQEPKLIVNGWGWVARHAIKSSRPYPTNQRETNFLRPAMEPKINTCVRPFRCRRCEPICCVINSCSIAMSFGVWCLWSMATSHFAVSVAKIFAIKYWRNAKAETKKTEHVDGASVRFIKSILEMNRLERVPGENLFDV